MPADVLLGLLKAGLEIDLPGGEREQMARRLAALGFVEVKERSYVRCSNPLDHDQAFAKDLTCEGRVYLQQGRDEEDDAYRCPSCARVVYPSRKLAALSLRCRPRLDSIRRYLAECLTAVASEHVERPSGVFRLVAGMQDAMVVLVDICPDAKYYEPRAIAANAVVFVVANDRDYLHLVPRDAEVFHVADLVLGEARRRFERSLRARLYTEPADASPLPGLLQHARARRTAPTAMTRTEVAPAATSPVLLVPRGTRWNEIQVYLVNGETVAIRVPGSKRRHLTYQELGMADGRNRQLTRPWMLLTRLCEGSGRCDWEGIARNFGAFTTLVHDLRERLKALFGLDDNPFQTCNKSTGLHAAFQAFPDLEGPLYVGEDDWP